MDIAEPLGKITDGEIGTASIEFESDTAFAAAGPYSCPILNGAYHERIQRLLAKAAIAKSMSSAVCAADICVRILAFPIGTTG